MLVAYAQNVASMTTLFTALDYVFTTAGFQGVYYLLHAFHNLLVLYETFPDVVTTFLYFHDLDKYTVNMGAAELVFALHFYHIALYYKKFRPDDWLHHGLMIFVALPLGVLLPASTLTGFSLFFSTGLPGGIDYALLFAVRNGWLQPMVEKTWNRRLNVWIRSPGCVAHAALALTYMLSGEGVWWQKTLGVVPPLLMYWNGQYFMEQVVADHAVRSERLA